MNKTILVNKRVEYALDGTPVIVTAKGKIYGVEFYYRPPRGTKLPDGHVLVRASSGEKWQARENKEKALADKSSVIADYIAVA